MTLAKALLVKLKVNRLEIASARISLGELKGVSQITSWAKENNFISKIEVLGFIDHKKSVDWLFIN